VIIAACYESHQKRKWTAVPSSQLFSYAPIGATRNEEGYAPSEKMMCLNCWLVCDTLVRMMMTTKLKSFSLPHQRDRGQPHEESIILDGGRTTSVDDNQ
jgi:hypothetical protein